MVSISTRREDWSIIDPVRDVKYLADRILKEEAKAARSGEPTAKRGLNPHVLAKLMPGDMREHIHGRKAMRVPMVHLIIRTYVTTFVENPQLSWGELCRLRRYLMMHILYTGLKTQHIDLAPVTLNTAETPEFMVLLIKRGNNREFTKMPNYRNYPVCFLAAEILCFLVHRYCSACPIVVEKFFRQIPGAPEELMRMIRIQSWYEVFAAIRLFGYTSSHPSACAWFLKNTKDLTKILLFSHGAEVVIEEHVSRDKMVNIEEELQVLCNEPVKKETYVRKTRIMATYASCMATLVFNNMMHHFGANYDDFLVLRKVVYDAKILPNFFKISRQLMRWLTPGRFMAGFLEGVYRCLEMDQATKLLFLDDFDYCRRHKIAPGWKSIEYFNHHALRPSHVTFLVCHALSMKYLIGAHWAIAILAYTLDSASDEVCRPIIETCGYELLDLAHILILREPTQIPIQHVLLEALLRYAGFSHKLWNQSDRFIGEPLPDKKVPEFCLEAALYCHRANLEEKLPLAEKQQRVKIADNKKDKGNTCFKKGRYREAIELYTEALSVCPLSARSKQAVYYSNRAECYLRVREPQRAVQDCNRSLCLDQTMCVTVQWRRSRAYQAMNLDYPAWLDMYCIKDDWKAEKVGATGVDFNELEDAFREKICLIEKDDSQMDMERKAVEYLWP